MRYSTLTILLLCIGLLGVDCGKDPVKRKLLEEPQTPKSNEVINEYGAEAEDLEDKAPVLISEEKIETNPANTAQFSFTISTDPQIEETGLEVEADSNTDTDKNNTSVAEARPATSFLSSANKIFTQILHLVGLSVQVKRTGKGIDFDSMEENEVSAYREGIRTTIGAALGKSECARKATCRAGKYLKSIKGKELIIVILEKLTPATWMDTVRRLKDSAIHNDKCEYKCMD